MAHDGSHPMTETPVLPDLLALTKAALDPLQSL